MSHNYAMSFAEGTSRKFRPVLVGFFCVLSIFSSPLSVVGKGVYDNQPPVSDKELVAFMEVLPLFRAWAISSKEDAHPYVNKAGKADFVFSVNAANWVRQRGWEPTRFFCVMGRTAAALTIVEEGNDLVTKRPSDMPTVTEAELELVRRHLATLLKAGNDAPPIKQ